MQNNVSPIGTTAGNNEPGINELAPEWLAAKAREAQARAEKIAAEDQMIAFGCVERHAGKYGSKSTKTESFKVTVKDERKAKMAQGLKPDALINVCRTHGLPDDQIPLKWSATIDVKALDAIKLTNPDLYFAISEVIEVYQAKPSFSIERVGAS